MHESLYKAKSIHKMMEMGLCSSWVEMGLCSSWVALTTRKSSACL